MKSPLFLSAALVIAGPLGAQDAGKVAIQPVQESCDACNRPDPGAPGATSPDPQSLPPPGPAPTSFRLAGIRLKGSQALPQSQVQDLIDAYVGRDVTLADLETLAKQLTARYRERGYFLAQAVIPVQTVEGGVVEIGIVEGRMGRIEVQVAPDAPIAEARVRGFLSPIEIGKAVNAPEYERAMLLLSDQPGIKVSSGLQEGLQTGTTDLAVDVLPTPRFTFAVEADNQGTKELGRYRAGGTVRWLSPLGIGDNLDARVLLSNSNALQYGRLAYEAPLGTGGLRAGVGIAHINYELGGAFSALDARGKADVADVSLSYPVIRQRQHNLFLRVSADTRKLTDEYRAVGFESDKRISGAGLGWTWERRDDFLGGGYFAGSGTLYRGHLSLRDAQSLQFDQSAAGHQTDGGYTKLAFQVSRLQTVLPRHSLFVSIGGQRAGSNLDPSEKLAIGGARAVRAYSGSEALVDQGTIGIAEWRWSVNDNLTPFAFYDAAVGRSARRPAATDGPNVTHLRGYGIGTSWSSPGSFSLNASLAWRDGTRAPQTDGGSSPRFFIQLQKVF